MAFLRKKDYEYLITEANLRQIIDRDDSLLSEAITTAQSEVESYLRNYYDVSDIFAGFIEFSTSIPFTTDDRIVWIEQPHSTAMTYDTGDFTVFNCIIYKALEDGITGAFNKSKWEEIAPNETYYYCIADSTESYPNDTDYFAKGDSRNQQIKTYTLDISLYHLHSRINPRNIPQLRMDRRDEAMKMLEKISDGKITADLPVRSDVDDVAGHNIIYGSNYKKTWGY